MQVSRCKEEMRASVARLGMNAKQSRGTKHAKRDLTGDSRACCISAFALPGGNPCTATFVPVRLALSGKENSESCAASLYQELALCDSFCFNYPIGRPRYPLAIVQFTRSIMLSLSGVDMPYSDPNLLTYPLRYSLESDIVISF